MKRIGLAALGAMIVLRAGVLCAGDAELLLDLSAAAPEAYGECSVYKKDAVAAMPEGLAFNGENSFIHLKTPKIEGSFAVALRVVLDALPEKEAVFAARRGYNNSVGCDKEGRVFFDIWGADKKERVVLRSERKLETGKTYDIVGVVDREKPAAALRLFIDGQPEGEAQLNAPPFAYAPELILGGANPYGQWNWPFKGKILRARLYRGIPSAEALAKQGAEAAARAAVGEDGSVSVADFGAQPGDGADDTGAVRAAFRFAVEKGARRLFFPKGVYDFSEAPGSLWAPEHWVFWMKGVENLEIDGGGSVFVMEGTQCFAYSRDCRDVTFRDMTLTSDRPFFSVGSVRNVSEDKYVFDVKLAPGALARGGEPVPSWEEVDENLLRVNGGMFVNYRVDKTRLVEPGLLRIFASDAMRPLKEGMKVLLRHHTYSASFFRLHESSGHKLENITLHNGLGMGVVGQYLDGIEIKNLRIVPAPDSPWPLSVSSDGVNLLGCYGRILIENCEFKGLKDDNINVFANIYGVKERLAPDRIYMNNPKFGSREMSSDRPGDTMLFMRDDLTVYARRTIKSIRHDHAMLHSEVEFTEALPYDLDAERDLVMAEKQPSEIVVRGNRFHSEGRLVLQCGQARVEDNDFLNSAGFHLQASITPWYEGRPAKNVVVRNNRFRNASLCGLRKTPAAICITAEGYSLGEHNLHARGALIKRPLHENVEIADNSIEDCNNAAMIFSSVKNLRVFGNSVKDVNRDPRVRPWRLEQRDWNLNAVTFAGGIENAAFENNRCAYSDDSARQGKLVVGLAIPEDAIRFRDNEGFEIGRAQTFPEENNPAGNGP